MDFKYPVIFKNNSNKNYEDLKVNKIKKQRLLSYHYYFEVGWRSKTNDRELIIKSHSFDDY